MAVAAPEGRSVNSSDRLRFALGLASVLAFVALGSPARAADAGCASGNALHATFDAADTHWNNRDAWMMRAGRLSLTPPAKGTTWTWDLGPSFHDATVCTVVLNHGGSADEFAGLTFWGTVVDGQQAFYFLMIKPDRTVAVFHVGDNKFEQVVAPRLHRSVKTGAGSVNTLRAVTKGKSVRLFVNGIQVAVVNTDRDEVPWSAGLIVEGSASPQPWVFTAFNASR
jgi:hypothetical protein